jgi:flagellar basal-body rod protein FlgB
VNEITDNSILAALGRQMNNAVARETVAASNLANIDTPGYRAREATFADALDDKLGPAAGPVRTNASHLGGGPQAGVATREVGGLPARRDGNNVQLDHELLSIGNAAADFSAAQTALAAKFRLVRYAINEGR